MEQIHLDVARNATDDFNLFHDKNKWQRIKNNPFNGPILLGFQLEAFIENQVTKQRSLEAIENLKRLAYSNYQFNFAGAINPGQPFELNIKKTRQSKDSTSNRVCIKSDNRLVISGLQKDTVSPLYLAGSNFSNLGNLSTIKDKDLVLNKQYFVKRKFMTTSNAKNFMTGSLVEQSDFIDETEDKVRFPNIFPSSFISCALLEKAIQEGVDFKENPSVYTQHKISINKNLCNQLKSNHPLYIFVQNVPFAQTTSLNCFGLTQANEILFRAIISLSQIDH